MQQTGTAAAHGAYLRRRRFGSLDGLRAFSVAGTVWHHTTVGIGWVGPAWFGSRLFGSGGLGVQMFFAISGFLITTLLLREHTRTGRLDLRGFYRRRVARIFPAYYATIAIYILLAFTLFSFSAVSRRFLGYLPAFMSYTMNWFVPVRAGETLFVQAWSLSTEEQFYLVWPLLLGLALSRRRGLRIAGGIALGLVAVKMVAGMLLAPSLLATVVGSLAVPICGGAVLALVLHSAGGFELASRLLGWPASALMSTAVLLALIIVGAPVLLVELVLVVVVGACVVREDHALASVLRWAPVAHLGRVSYGVYLYHVIFLWLVRLYLGVPSGPVLFVLVLAGTVWAAAISFRFFEEPVRVRITGRRTRSVVAEPASAALL